MAKHWTQAELDAPRDYELRPFIAKEAETVASWAATPDDMWRLSGLRDEVPLSADQLVAWTFESNYAFTLRWNGDLAAYGEIIEDDVEGDVEIQHLLVVPDMRGIGVGKAILSRLCAFLAAAQTYPEVWLRAGRDNPAMGRCARAVGFEDVGEMSGERYLWLKKMLTTEA